MRVLRWSQALLKWSTKVFSLTTNKQQRLLKPRFSVTSTQEILKMQFYFSCRFIVEWCCYCWYYKRIPSSELVYIYLWSLPNKDHALWSHATSLDPTRNDSARLYQTRLDMGVIDQNPKRHKKTFSPIA